MARRNLARDRVPVRTLEAADLPAVATIDRRITGRDRTAYYRRKFDEVLNESGIRLSMIATADATTACFIIARVDYGEFGMAQSEAVIDTIGVDPSSRAGYRLGAARGAAGEFASRSGSKRCARSWRGIATSCLRSWRREASGQRSGSISPRFVTLSGEHRWAAPWLPAFPGQRSRQAERAAYRAALPLTSGGLGSGAVSLTLSVGRPLYSESGPTSRSRNMATKG